MSDAKQSVRKKVRPYPFPATLETTPPVKKTFEVVLLNLKGLIGRMDKTLVHVGEHYTVEFDLPAQHKSIVTKVRVMRTYDKVMNVHEKTVDRMAEFHFENLESQNKSRIEGFLAAIKQET